MKRVILAVVLLLIIGGGCAVTLWMQTVTTTELIAETERLETLFKQEDTVGAIAASEAFVVACQKACRRFSIFLPHAMLTEVEQSAVNLPAILRYGEPTDYVKEVHRCRLALQKVKELDRPTLQNIF